MNETPSNEVTIEVLKTTWKTAKANLLTTSDAGQVAILADNIAYASAKLALMGEYDPEADGPTPGDL